MQTLCGGLSGTSTLRGRWRRDDVDVLVPRGKGA